MEFWCKVFRSGLLISVLFLVGDVYFIFVHKPGNVNQNGGITKHRETPLLTQQKINFDQCAVQAPAPAPVSQTPQVAPPGGKIYLRLLIIFIRDFC